MTIADIIKSVRLCYDDEAVNGAELANAYSYGGGSFTDMATEDNIIKSKIGDAFRWICLYAPAELLGGSDEVSNGEPVDTGILVDTIDLSCYYDGDQEGVAITEDQNAGVKVVHYYNGCTRIQMPMDFIKLSRVRVDGWHRAIKTPITEDSEEYLQLQDPNGAQATFDRPVVAIIDKKQTELELWPTRDDDNTFLNISFVRSTDGNPIMGTGTNASTIVGYAIPPKVKTSFIYYIAFLVLSSYADPRAESMLNIAKMNLGINP